MRGPLLAVAVLFPIIAIGQPITGTEQALGIRNSNHDLSNTGTARIHNANTTANQICIYCHTPHHAQSTQLVWNHTQTSNTLSWGNDLDGNPLTATTMGTPLPTALKNASKRCLGCHDGSVAIGDVSNAGNGGSVVSSGGTYTITNFIAGLESIVNSANGYQYTDANGHLADVRKQIAVGGNMGGTHPVSIPYAGQTGYNGLTSKAVADNAVGNYFATQSGPSCVNTTGFCTTGAGSAEIIGTQINLIPEVSNAGGNVAGALGVECVTCHEPHSKFGYDPFLRVSVKNASGLCRSCHNK
jgi:hypothetical protein